MTLDHYHLFSKDFLTFSVALPQQCKRLFFSFGYRWYNGAFPSFPAVAALVILGGDGPVCLEGENNTV